jgi:hypothetical protein
MVLQPTRNKWKFSSQLRRNILYTSAKIKGFHSSNQGSDLHANVQIQVDTPDSHLSHVAETITLVNPEKLMDSKLLDASCPW